MRYLEGRGAHQVPPVLRSLLYVPAHESDKVAKAVKRQLADALILDLEDGVPRPRKAEARRLVAGLSSSGITTLVRVSSVDAPEHDADIEAVLQAAAGVLHGVVLAKCEGGHHVEAVSERLPQLSVWPLIETPAGVERMDSLVAVGDRLGGLMLGAGDLLTAAGATWTPDELSLLYARTRLVYSAAVLGLNHAIDTPDPNTADLDLLRQRSLAARALGLTGKAVIHPAQLEVVEVAFGVDERQVTWARDVIAALDRGGSRLAKGQVQDEATLRLARSILARAGEQTELVTER